MSDYRYKLEGYNGMKSRYRCSDCNHAGKFARYIDTETNEYLGDKVGRCERLDKCGYHYTPKQFFSDNGIVPNHNTDVASYKAVEPEKAASHIDTKLFEKTLSNYEHNNFITYLRSLFDDRTVNNLIEKFKIGTSKHWPGSTIFWQVDIAGNIRTGKIMQYDPGTGKRIKVPHDRIQWVHKVTKAVDYNLKQCLFGEHQLLKNDLPIAVVESEKTAIIASGYLPQFTWVASGNKQGLSVDKCNALKANCNNKPVVLYPDLNAYKEWSQKAKLYKFKISDLLEKKASTDEKENGLDLADYLVRLKVEDFSKAAVVDAIPSIQEPIQVEISDPPRIEVPTIKYTQPIKEQWILPNFEGLTIPSEIVLDVATKITDLKNCINSHLAMVEANNGKLSYKPYLNRLKIIHSLIS